MASITRITHIDTYNDKDLVQGKTGESVSFSQLQRDFDFAFDCGSNQAQAAMSVRDCGPKDIVILDLSKSTVARGNEDHLANNEKVYFTSK